MPLFECRWTTQVLRPKKQATNINNIPKPSNNTFSFPVTEKLTLSCECPSILSISFV